MIVVLHEKFWVQCIILLSNSCAVWLYSGSAGFAQTATTSSAQPSASHARLKTHAVPPALTRLATANQSLVGKPEGRATRQLVPADEAAQPAMVSLIDGKLSVDANNSDLTQILQKLSDLSGMAISGLDKGPRIFGVYGPGNSRDVLADLLVGSGYNFLIVGGAIDGTPRELVLTSQSADIVDLFSVKPVPTPFADRDDPRLPTPERDSTTSVATGPGAISPAPSQDDKDDVTHRQQTLQRLQQIQEQQKAPE
jgi:hypothetical protein